ncbi:unnamed protein product [Linum trigynum]|uniref:Uncharacterized protein n=1 Tax=Linum trigynum TaxID=586398 RepID=A0AAV2GHU1_9ROSI
MAEHDSNIPGEVTPIKAMTTPRVFADLAEASNRDAVLIKEEEPELAAKEMRQLMAKQNGVIADMQKQMSQVIALMMSKEAAATPDAAPVALQLTQGEASGAAPPPQQAAVELSAPKEQRNEPPGRADLSFLEQHLSPQFRPNPPRKILHQPLCTEIMAENPTSAVRSLTASTCSSSLLCKTPRCSKASLALLVANSARPSAPASLPSSCTIIDSSTFIFARSRLRSC